MRAGRGSMFHMRGRRKMWNPCRRSLGDYANTRLAPKSFRFLHRRAYGNIYKQTVEGHTLNEVDAKRRIALFDGAGSHACYLGTPVRTTTYPGTSLGTARLTRTPPPLIHNSQPSLLLTSHPRCASSHKPSFSPARSLVAPLKCAPRSSSQPPHADSTELRFTESQTIRPDHDTSFGAYIDRRPVQEGGERLIV